MNYDRPTLDDFREARRALPLVAAVLFALALAFPMWVITVNAVQYPSTTLRLELYAYPRIAGDYAEMAALNQYIGFYYPDPVLLEPNYEPNDYAVDVPEWSLGPLAFLAVAASNVFVSLAPDVERLKRGLRYQFAGTVAVFGVMLVDIQYRLYQAGHHLDPAAPVMGVDGFTPPLWGTYSVANITSRSSFGLGAYLTMLSIALLALAYHHRDDDVTLGALPGRLRERLGGVRDRLPGVPDAPTEDPVDTPEPEAAVTLTPSEPSADAGEDDPVETEVSR
jgi:hypothetical protein